MFLILNHEGRPTGQKSSSFDGILKKSTRLPEGNYYIIPDNRPLVGFIMKIDNTSISVRDLGDMTPFLIRGKS